MRYFVKGLLKVFGKSKFSFYTQSQKVPGPTFKIARYVQRFLSLVVHHLTIFHPKIQRGFSSFSNIKVSNSHNTFHDVIIPFSTSQFPPKIWTLQEPKEQFR